MARAQSLKEVLIEKTAADLGQSTHLVADVIRWVFKDINKAAKIYKEIEISGFGKLILSQPKLRKRIARHEQMKQRMEALPQTEDMMTKIEGVNEDLIYYYSKLETNETKQKKLKDEENRNIQDSVPYNE